MPELTDESPCPVDCWYKGAQYQGVKMANVPDRLLIKFYEKPLLKSKHPDVYAYIVRNANVLPDLILRKEDRK